MIVNLVYDMSQYRLCLDPLRDELVRRGHEIVYSKGGPKSGVDCAVLIQAPGPVQGSKRPRFFIQHGLSCTKGWSNNQDIEYYVCPGPYWKEELKGRMESNSKQRKFPLLLGLGWPRMDVWHRLLQMRGKLIDWVRERHELDDSRPIVCYFPTYAGGGHSVRECNVADVYNKLASEFHCFVGPHQMEGGRKVEYMKQMPESTRSKGPSKRLILYEGRPNWDKREGLFLSHVPEGAQMGKWELSVNERLAYIVASDAMVSDTSGIAFEYTCTGQPLILLDKLGDKNYLKLNHTDQGRVFDVGARAVFATLCEVIVDQLAHPGEFASRRQFWRDYVVGPVDGKCASRIIDFMEIVV